MPLPEGSQLGDRIAQGALLRSWSVGPDGERFLVSRFERLGQPITTVQVVLNWSDELQRLAPAR